MVLISQIYFSQSASSETALADLVLRTNGGGVRPNYAWFIAKDLRYLGFEVTIRVDEWTQFYGALLETHDYDMGIVGLSGGGDTPDMRNLYTENGNLNVFGLDREIPYGNLSEIMQEEGMMILDPVLRQQHYYEWEQLMMNRIVPMLPLFTTPAYTGTWSNLQGYQATWGFTDSLPYMFFDGYHDGQESLDEFNIADTNWGELNPMFIDSYEFYHIVGHLLNEELVELSPGLEPLKTGLVTDWQFISDSHIKFFMRDNVFWNPSYNVTERDEFSPSLETISQIDLMQGLKNNEFSDGTNQQVTAKDAVFTLLLWSNLLISEDTSYHKWISNIYVDPTDPLAFHVYIDGDPATPQIEPFVDIWESLNWIIMPEFFLNSTDSTVSYTSGGIKCTGLYEEMINTPQWRAYSTSQFGCGKYMLDYFIKNEQTVLRANPNWKGVGAIDGTNQDLDIQTIIVKVIPDQAKELAHFLKGELDWIGLSSFPAIRKIMEKEPRFNVQDFLTKSMSFLFFNLQRPFIGGVDNFVYLDEPGLEEYTKACAIRKAICYIIDREEINNRIHNGEYIVCNSVLYPYLGFYYYNDIIKYNYDLYAALFWLGYPFPDIITHSTTSSTNAVSLVNSLSIVFFVSIIISYKKRKQKINT